MHKPRHYVIYVPGLSDSLDFWRRLALKTWRIFGVRTELVPMTWYDGDTFDSKVDRVMVAVQNAEMKGYIVSLVGESAGSSMAINAAVRHPQIHRVITIAGANDPDAQVSPVTLKKSPAFDVSLQKLRESLSYLYMERTHTVRAIADGIVNARHTIIKGAHNHVVPSVGHMVTITLCLTVLSWRIVSLIKRRD